MTSYMPLLAAFAWAIVATCITVAALRKRSIVTRAIFGFLAACVVLGLTADVGTLGRRALSASEDRAWSQIRSSYVERMPALGAVITLNPVVENEFRRALLPVIRDRQGKAPAALDTAVATAIGGVLDKHILPVAAHGSTEAVNAWGGANTAILQRLAAVSIEACAEYAMTNIARSADDKEIVALTEAGYRSLIDAYKTSNSSNQLPDQDALSAQYDKAMLLAKPPFTKEDSAAFDALEKESRQRQCSLTLRLFEGIDRLDPGGKAMIFRRMMKSTD